MSIVTSIPPARYGYRAVVAGHVIPVRDLTAAASELVAARESGARIEVTARVTLTRERPLTQDEQQELVAHAIHLINRQEQS